MIVLAAEIPSEERSGRGSPGLLDSGAFRMSGRERISG